MNGRPVGNVYAYDAAGRPLVGVQLFDQEGSRLVDQPDAVRRAGDPVQGADSRGCTGATRLSSVFPMPAQAADPDTGEAVGPPHADSAFRVGRLQ